MMIDGVSRGRLVWPLILSLAVQHRCWRTVPTRELATRASAIGGQERGHDSRADAVTGNRSGWCEGGIAERPQSVVAAAGQLTRHRHRRAALAQSFGDLLVIG